MRKFCFLLLCGVIGWVGAAGGAGPTEWPAEVSHLKQHLGDPEAFVAAIREFDKTQKRLADTEQRLAKSLAQQQNTQLAREKGEAAQKRLDLVRQAYELGLQYHRDNAQLHNYYGELLYDVYREFPSAVKEWNLALAMDRRLAGAHNNLALHMFHTGSYAPGLNHLDRALELDKKNPDYLYNAVQIYLIHSPQIQDIRRWGPKTLYRKAIAMSKRAAELAPNDFELLQDYAVNFFAAERYGVEAKWKRAAAAWQNARARARNDVERFFSWLNEGRVWLAADEKDKAAVCLKEALRINPESPVAKSLLHESRKNPR